MALQALLMAGLVEADYTGTSPVQLHQAPVSEDQSELEALIKYSGSSVEFYEPMVFDHDRL